MKEDMLIRERKHPLHDIICYSDGCIYMPPRIHTKGHFTYGTLNRKGYRVITIGKKQYRINRILAETFIPNPENKPTVDHINRDRDDNRVENLRWATLSEQKNNSSLVINRLDLGTRQSEDPDKYTIAWRDYAHRNIYMYGPVRQWRNTHREWCAEHWKSVREHSKDCRGRRHKE